MLVKLFVTSLQREVRNLNENQVRLQFIGDRERFPEKLRQSIKNAETLTATNTGLRLIVAANYGGRWDITNACRQLGGLIESGKLTPAQIDEELMQSHLSLSELPEPDLFIRTGGEKRLSNYLLWQIAYTELYFTEMLWPDFDEKALEMAFHAYTMRERRFGMTSEQLRGEVG